MGVWTWVAWVALFIFFPLFFVHHTLCHSIPISGASSNLGSRTESSTPPSNLPLDEIPMFLTITFDDALHADSDAQIAKILSHTNPNDEPIPLVYFISNYWTDYKIVQQRYLEGSEMGIHTVTHTTQSDSNLTKWYLEITKSRKYMSKHAGIPKRKLNGFRAPFLAKSDLTYKVLTANNFLYDSTIVSALDDNGMFTWSYTLDYFDVARVYNIGQGSRQSYPGFWVISMYQLYKLNSKKRTTSKMSSNSMWRYSWTIL